MAEDFHIDGSCDPRFDAVREAFARNFREEDELGAAVCVRSREGTLVDLWGGHSDKARRIAWSRDTLTNAYSVGKGVLTALALILVECGKLELDAPVARLWPGFEREGKGEITLRMLLSHRSGLPAVREPLPEGAMLDWDRMCSALAEQAPYWTPDEGHGYHVNTFGYLIGELIRRATGMRVGEALREFITGPLDADYHWGLERSKHGRVAEICTSDADYQVRTQEQWAAAFPPTGDPESDQMVWHAYFNPSGISGIGAVNTAAWRMAEIPSTNGLGNARGISAIFRAFISPSAAPSRWISPSLLGEATRIHSEGEDKVLRRPSRFAMGFQLVGPPRFTGPSPGAFGHMGRGGSLGFADPDAGIAFGYVLNLPGSRWYNPRTQALVAAVYDCLSTTTPTRHSAT